MEKKDLMLESIPAEKFRFVNQDERIHDKKFDDKPIGYFKDAWIRFKKSKASVVAAIIILLILLYAFYVRSSSDPTTPLSWPICTPRNPAESHG